MGGSTLFILIDWFHFTTKYLDMHLLNKHQTLLHRGECRENTHERNASLWKQLPTGWGVSWCYWKDIESQWISALNTAHLL